MVFSHFASHFFKSILLMITYTSINIHPYCFVYGLFEKYYFVAILSIPNQNRKRYFERVPEAPSLLWYNCCFYFCQCSSIFIKGKNKKYKKLLLCQKTVALFLIKMFCLWLMDQVLLRSPRLLNSYGTMSIHVVIALKTWALWQLFWRFGRHTLPIWQRQYIT